MKLYIAGKITGDKNYRRKFKKAEKVLKRHGHTVLNPSILPNGLTWEDYIHIDKSIIDICDGVCFLPDWRESKGATYEYKYAHDKNKDVFFFAEKFSSNYKNLKENIFYEDFSCV